MTRVGLGKTAMLMAAAKVLASMPLPPVQVEYLDRPKPAPNPKKRAKVKAARKQRNRE